jgi:cation-transporting P-type ATPase E
VEGVTIPGTESLRGLSSAEAEQRAAAGKSNRTTGHSERTTAQIIQANVFTRFNAILGLLLVIILTMGPAVDGLFGIILVLNTCIGVVQEVRAKRTLDKLALLTATTIPVLRDQQQKQLASARIVQGDIVGTSTGAQIVVDGPVLISNGLEIDESLLTGEAEPQAKEVGDQLRSGSFVTAGSGWFQAEKVGNESFANTISSEARKFAPVRSELKAATDTVLKLVTWAIGPIAAALLIGQRMGGETWRSAVFGSATGVVEIVPEGFVLLTSMTLALSIIRLGKQGILVKELGAVEGLARVDTICFDKTGTLTEGAPAVDEIRPVGAASLELCSSVLRVLSQNPSNATAKAIQKATQDASNNVHQHTLIPFSSARKWAAVSVSIDDDNKEASSWVMGAPEIVLAAGGVANNKALEQVKEQTDLGKRVLVLATTSAVLSSDDLPPDLQVSAIVMLTERIRPDAQKTLQYFAEQHVDIKIISGDNQKTVAAIARSVGMTRLDVKDTVVDARTLPDDEAVANMIAEAKVIGRSTPRQKRIMVQSLRQQHKTVAMTGDGVNDALALKDANLAIAMGSGSEATRAVAQLVLVDGGFSSLPGVVAEGRRVIANVERVAKLFLTKTVYAMVLAVATGVARVPFPFLPRQLTLISALTIGIPGFFLALAPQAPTTQPGFLKRVAEFALPAGVTAAVATFAAYTNSLQSQRIFVPQARTAATMVLGLVGLWIVDVLARPLNTQREALLVTLGSVGVASFIIPVFRQFWRLEFPPTPQLIESFGIALIAIAIIEVGWRLATFRRKPDQPLSEVVT